VSTVRFTEHGRLGVLTLDSPPLNLIGQARIDEIRLGIVPLAGGVEQVAARAGKTRWP
jgi:hypothetical protein